MGGAQEASQGKGAGARGQEPPSQALGADVSLPFFGSEGFRKKSPGPGRGVLYLGSPSPLRRHDKVGRFLGCAVLGRLRGSQKTLQIRMKPDTPPFVEETTFWGTPLRLGSI